MIQLVIFDIGGAILDSPDLFKALSSLFPSSISQAKIQEEIKSLILKELTQSRTTGAFKTMEKIIIDSLKYAASRHAVDVDYSKAIEIYWDTYVNGSTLKAGVIETFQALTAWDITLMLCSDADAELINAEIKRFNIGHFFNEIIISSDVKAYKANRKMITFVKNKIISYKIDEILFVGDAEVDIITAQQLSIKSVRIGDNKDNLFGEDYNISTFVELLGLI